MKRLSLAELSGLPVLGSVIWKPVRKSLGVTAFGINAYTATNAGDEVIEDHTESQLGHEEVYVVLEGHATFTVDGEEVDAPAGTLVFLDDPAQRRSAVAHEPGTTVLAVGGKPGVHEVSPWEYFFPALPLMAIGEYDAARKILLVALEETDAPAVHYQLACAEARLGEKERALTQLRTAIDGAARCREWAAGDEDFASLRDDARFIAMIRTTHSG